MARKTNKGNEDMPAAEAKLRAVRLELEEPIHKLLRLEAAKADTSLAALARELVEEGLKRRAKP